MNVYRGRSGQLWIELARHDNCIALRPEYHGGRGTDGMQQTILTIPFFESCGFELVGETEDGERVEFFEKG